MYKGRGQGVEEGKKGGEGVATGRGRSGFRSGQGVEGGGEEEEEKV